MKKVVTLSLIFFLTFMGKGFSYTEISIPKTAEVEAFKDVKLVDIANFTSKEKKRLFSEIVIFESLKPGNKKYLYKAQLSDILKKYGIDNCKIYMEKRALIKANFYEFSQVDAVNELDEYLAQNYNNTDFKISKVTLVGNRTFKDKDFDLVEVDFNGKDPKAGNNRGLFKIYSGEKLVKVRFITKLIKEVEIVCASNDLKKGDLLNDKNVFLKKVSLEREKGDYFTDKNSLSGLKLRRNYKKGEIITSAMTFKPSLVNRGDDVQIVAVNGSLSVVTKGIAGRDGHLGEIIPVLNKKSKKTISGEIVSSNSVMVAF